MNALGEVMLVGYADGRVVVWDLFQAQKLKEFQMHESPVTCVDVNREGSLAVVGSSDGEARLLDLKNGSVLRGQTVD